MRGDGCGFRPAPLDPHGEDRRSLRCPHSAASGRASRGPRGRGSGRQPGRACGLRDGGRVPWQFPSRGTGALRMREAVAGCSGASWRLVDRSVPALPAVEERMTRRPWGVAAVVGLVALAALLVAVFVPSGGSSRGGAKQDPFDTAPISIATTRTNPAARPPLSTSPARNGRCTTATVARWGRSSRGARWRANRRGDEWTSRVRSATRLCLRAGADHRARRSRAGRTNPLPGGRMTERPGCHLRWWCPGRSKARRGSRRRARGRAAP